jgi:hypothetical protein
MTGTRPVMTVCGGVNDVRIPQRNGGEKRSRALALAQSLAIDLIIDMNAARRTSR